MLWRKTEILYYISSYCVFAVGLRCGEWHKRWLKWPQSWMSGQKTPGVGELPSMDLTLSQEAPGSGLPSCMPHLGQPSPSSFQRAAFISLDPDRPWKMWSRRGAQKEEGTWLHLWGLVAVLFTWVHCFTVGRGLWNGSGDICSTLFTLKFQTIS